MALAVVLLCSAASAITYVVIRRPFVDTYEVVDQLGGNLFPSAILSVATTDAQIIKPMAGNYVGNPKACIGIRLRSGRANTVVRVELDETPFYARSISTFVLPKEHTDYTIYPDILWRYDALRDNEQAEPISVVAHVEVNGKDWGQQVRTFSVRSINECLLGYTEQLPSGGTKYVSTDSSLLLTSTRRIPRLTAYCARLSTRASYVASWATKATLPW